MIMYLYIFQIHDRGESLYVGILEAVCRIQ
jgi:hypothetical protein